MPSPIQKIPASANRKWLSPIICSIVCIAGILLFGLQIAGLLVAFASMLWLFVRGAKDAAFQDPLLFLMGFSIVAYVIGRWDRAKAPLLCFFGGFAASYIGTLLSQQ